MTIYSSMIVLSLIKASFKIGRVGVEPTYEYLIRVSDATGLPSAPYCKDQTCPESIISSTGQLSTLEGKFQSF